MSIKILLKNTKYFKNTRQTGREDQNQDLFNRIGNQYYNEIKFYLYIKGKH